MCVPWLFEPTSSLLLHASPLGIAPTSSPTKLIYYFNDKNLLKWAHGMYPWKGMLSTPGGLWEARVLARTKSLMHSQWLHPEWELASHSVILAQNHTKKGQFGNSMQEIDFIFLLNKIKEVVYMCIEDAAPRPCSKGPCFSYNCRGLNTECPKI